MEGHSRVQHKHHFTSHHSEFTQRQNTGTTCHQIHLKAGYRKKKQSWRVTLYSAIIEFLLNYMIINHFNAHCISSWNLYSKKGVWAEPVQEEEERGGGASTESHGSAQFTTIHFSHSASNTRARNQNKTNKQTEINPINTLFK